MRRTALTVRPMIMAIRAVRWKVSLVGSVRLPSSLVANRPMPMITPAYSAAAKGSTNNPPECLMSSTPARAPPTSGRMTVHCSGGVTGLK